MKNAIEEREEWRETHGGGAVESGDGGGGGGLRKRNPIGGFKVVAMAAGGG